MAFHVHLVFSYFNFSMNSVLVTVRVWHSRANPSSYLKKSVNIRDNTDIFLTRFPSLIKFLPIEPTSNTLPQELALFSATLRGHYFVESSMWNINFGCRCVYCRHWGSYLRGLAQHTYSGTEHSLKKKEKKIMRKTMVKKKNNFANTHYT